MTRPSPFVWYELMTTDPEAASVFYGDVVGWRPRAWQGGYTVMSAGEAEVAGIMALPPEARDAGARPGWIGCIGVADVDVVAAEVAASGGRVHRAPSDFPGAGRLAVVADPQGAMFTLFAPRDGAPNRPAPMAPGQVGWHELYAVDGAQAFDFYAGLFGWTREEALDIRTMGTYQTFAPGEGPAIGGMMTRPPGVPVSGWLYYFNVEAVDAAAARVAAGGGRVVRGPMEVPGGAWIVQAADPQGAPFALVAPRR